jgi:hypothetical protein
MPPTPGLPAAAATATAGAIHLVAIAVGTASNTVGLPGGMGGHGIGRADGITIGLQAAGLLAVALPRLLPTGRLGALALPPAVVAMFALGAVSVVDLQSHGHAHTHDEHTHDEHAPEDPREHRRAGVNADEDHPNDGDEAGHDHDGDTDHDGDADHDHGHGHGGDDH